MNVPFLDLKAQYKQIEHEVVPLVTEAMGNGMFIGGPNVEGFEKEFAEYCSTKYCIGVNSGTDALRFALMAAGVGSGDEVITVPNTFIATTEAISQVGASPVFVDVDPDTCNMDPVKISEFMEQEYSLDESTDQLINQNLIQTGHEGVYLFFFDGKRGNKTQNIPLDTVYQKPFLHACSNNRISLYL